MNIDALHLKKTLWKSFDVFPEDSKWSEEYDYATAFIIIYVCVPNVFTYFKEHNINYEVFEIAADNRKVVDVKTLNNVGTDGANETFKFLKRMKKLEYDKNDPCNFKNHVIKIIDEYCTEGYFPDRKKWCKDFEFERIFQESMFESM